MASDYDVVVVGSGIAGLSAALTVVEAGGTVLVAESEDVVGGSTRLAGGSIMGAGTRLQADHGVSDSAEDLFQYYMALNHWEPEPGPVRRLADECGPAVDWLVDLGVAFQDGVYPAGEEPAPRKHLATGAGQGVIDVLYRQCKDRGVEFAMRRRIDRLIVEGGDVVGVAVGDDELRAGAVILSTGGFGANKELVDEHFPDAGAAEWYWYVGAPGSRGDAFGLGRQVDAEILGHNLGLLMLTPNFGKLLEGGYLPGWLVVVNGRGRRFYNETMSYSVTHPIVRSQPAPVVAIFDDDALRAADPKTAEQVKRNTIPQRTFYVNKWVEPMLTEMVEKGVVKRADTLPELAAQVGVPGDELVATIERYNIDVGQGHDELYLKAERFLRPIQTPPFYATELRLAHVPLTGAGLRIDADSRVLAKGASPVPGLYAAGECTGGVLGQVYVGSGNSLTMGLVFGRVAGRSALAHSRADMKAGIGTPE